MCVEVWTETLILGHWQSERLTIKKQTKTSINPWHISLWHFNDVAWFLSWSSNFCCRYIILSTLYAFIFIYNRSNSQGSKKSKNNPALCLKQIIPWKQCETWTSTKSALHTGCKHPTLSEGMTFNIDLQFQNSILKLSLIPDFMHWHYYNI